jgi:hypothetical protein
VVWVFAKDGRELRCELTRTNEPASYHLAVSRPDQTATVEEIADPAGLVDRLVAVMLDIRADGWLLA